MVTEEAVEDYSKDQYGNMKMVQSEEKLERNLFSIKCLNPKVANEKVWIRGRLHTSRAKGTWQFFFPTNFNQN